MANLNNEPNSSDNQTKVALLSIAITLVMEQSTLIWARYNNMLLTNSVVLGVLGVFYAKPTWAISDLLVIVIACAIGIRLTLLWKGQMDSAWELQQYLMNGVRSIKLDSGFQNPWEQYDLWRKHKNLVPSSLTPTMKSGKHVIHIFTFTYFSTLLISIVSYFWIPVSTILISIGSYLWFK